MLSFINKIFGNKSDRDVKSVKPIVDKIKEEYEKLGSLSHDELRAKTAAFRVRIKSDLAEIDGKIAAIKKNVEENVELTIHEKTDLYDEVDRLEKDRNKQLETTL